MDALILLMILIIIDVKCFEVRPMNVRSRINRLYSSSVGNQDLYDFKSLSKLAGRVDKLLSNQVEFMSSFWSDELNCFQIIPVTDISNSRVSITSTCLSIKAILDNRKYWSKVVRWEDSRNTIKSTNPNSINISLKKVVSSLNNVPWSFDSFQTPLLLQTLCSLNSVNSTNEKIIDAIEHLLEQRSRLSLHRSQVNSAYLRYQNAKALLAIVENGAVPEHIIGTNRIGFALERQNVVSFDEVCRQLAFYNCGDSGNFDVVILAFSLLNYYETSNSLFLTSFARGVVSGVNLKLVKASLEVIFNSQADDGTWRKGEPINSKADKSMRDIGNNYVFFFDLVGSLLGTMAEKDPFLIAPYLPQLEKCLMYAESNILEEMLGDVCDPVSNRCYGRVVRGWRSNHLGTGSAVAWSTAQVILFLSGMRKLLQNLMTTNILTEFNGKRETLVGNPNEWQSLMDADLKLGPDFETTLKEVFENRLLLPQVQKESAIKAQFSKKIENSSSSLPDLYSAILFGPPGTAKTTICTSAASYLGITPLLIF